MKKIGILNGPNLSRLGKREPTYYGKTTLPEIEEMLRNHCESGAVELCFKQSEHEGQLVETLHEWDDANTSGIIFNPAAYGHTSIALRDAIATLECPVLEVHLSNIHAREAFRSHTMTSAVCCGVISGLGAHGYLLALSYFMDQ